MRINKMLGNALITYQILTTNSFRKCMEVSLEHLYVDMTVYMLGV